MAWRQWQWKICFIREDLFQEVNICMVRVVMGDGGYL